MKFGADFVITEDSIDVCVDAALETKRRWSIRRFFVKPVSEEIVKVVFSRDSELVRNAQLVQLAAIGLFHLRMSKSEIKETLRHLLERYKADNFRKDETPASTGTTRIIH